MFDPALEMCPLELYLRKHLLSLILAMSNTNTSQIAISGHPCQASRVFDFGEQCGAVDLDDGSRAEFFIQLSADDGRRL